MAKRRDRGTGSTRQLASGRWQARFRGPDGRMRPAPVTYDTKLDADAWLKAQAGDVARGTWVEPEAAHGPKPTLKEYSATWLDTRELKPRTVAHYRKLLDRNLLPGLGATRIDRISPATVRTWYATLDPKRPTSRAHSYSLLRTILNTAYSDDLIDANPCRIRGAGRAPVAKEETVPATLAELVVIVENMPDRLRPMVLLAAWCAMRFGELTELRRRDVDLAGQQVWVRRGVTYTRGEARGQGTFHVLDPKSRAGKRSISIPPHLLPVLRKHLKDHVDTRPDALLFPSWRDPKRHLALGTLQTPWETARAAAGRPDLRFHDLRHTGATLAAATGATLADLMKRLGHGSQAAALRYQHAVADRDRAIAEALSGFARAQVIELRPAASTRRGASSTSKRRRKSSA